MRCFRSNRIYKKDIDSKTLAKIQESSLLYNQMKHYSYSLFIRNIRQLSNEKPDYNTLKSRFPDSNPYLRNSALNDAKAVFSSQLELRKLYIENTKEQIAKTKRKLLGIQKKYDNLKIINSNLKNNILKTYKGCNYIKFNKNGTVVVFQKSYDNVYLFEKQYLHPKLKELRARKGTLKFKINKLEDKLSRLEDDTKFKAIVFGSKKILKHSMITSKMTKRERKIAKQKKLEYKHKRYSSFEVSGRNDSNFGNFFFQYDINNNSLKLIDNKEIFVLNGVYFPYGQEEINSYYRTQSDYQKEWLAARKKANLLTKTTGEKVCPVITNKSRPITYAIEDMGEYFIIKCLYTDEPKEHLNYSTTDGVIAIDKNVGFLSVVEINSKGQLISVKDYHYDYKNKSSNQIKNNIELVVKEIVDLAVSKNKPIVCERIRIKGNKKLSDYNDNKSKNFTKNMFAYNKIDQALKSRSYKLNVAVIEVSPAYTSFIGKVKYKPVFKKSTHQMAAYVIGRRGMGFNETIPNFYKATYNSKINFKENKYKQWKQLYKLVS